MDLLVLEGMHGLAILCDRPRLAAAPGLRAGLERLRSPEFQREWLLLVERARIGSNVRLRDAERRLADAERRVAELERRLLEEPGEATGG